MIEIAVEIALWRVWLSVNPDASYFDIQAFLLTRTIALGVSVGDYTNAITNAITSIGNPAPPPPPPWQFWPDFVLWFFGSPPIQPIPGPIQP